MSAAQEADAFFAANPCDLHDLAARVEEFVTAQQAAGRLVACVTSGGTIVPLERTCVRFIDNFSRGTRGALSVEQFIEAGYGVIFLTRAGTVQPYSDGLPEGELQERMLDLLSPHGGDGSDAESAKAVAASARRACEVEAAGLLLRLRFTTLFEYLQSLRAIAAALEPLGPTACFYLAAAVSDFYLPWADMAQHKIQSSDGPLELRLPKVPKMVAALRQTWAPRAFVVSFKLETDETILLRKAEGAIDHYDVHVVVANLLETRKDRVWLVRRAGNHSPGAVSSADSRNIGDIAAVTEAPGSTSMTGGKADQGPERREQCRDDSAGRTSKVSVQVIGRPAADDCIEVQLVGRVVRLHGSYLQTVNQSLMRNLMASLAVSRR